MKSYTRDNPLIQWLLDGDVSIQYQVHRDLLDEPRPDLQARIATEGWGTRFLSLRKGNGDWGQGFYKVKWISSHYTLLDLRNLGIAQDNYQIRASIDKILDERVAEDGGVNPAGTIKESDVCINGMFLYYATYFGLPQERLISIVDFIVRMHMPDGGFNCRLNRSGAVHSSMHTTISILEGINAYDQYGYLYGLEELQETAAAAREFLLQHRLFRSDRTGQIIDKRYLMLSFPSRWRYDILRALDYFQSAAIPYDPRMQDALDVLLKKRRKDGIWPVQARHPGKTHFEMEKTGGPSRWNTLRALRVLKHFDHFHPSIASQT
ncbi:MAG: hypothetical protein R3293_16185 [Candidatus Promineifilaceae bacterium]|nr:hypothetical protein [Candidatus Promineifilaceae bacterium]